MSTSHGKRHGPRPLAIAAAGALALLAWSAGPTQAHPLYDTTRVVQQQGNACLATKGCRIIAVKSRRIQAGAAQQIVGRCPDDRPYFVNWDATHHEHVGLRVQDSRRGGVTVIAINHADVPGRVTLHIGCATGKVAQTAQLQSLEALPSKALKGVSR